MSAEAVAAQQIARQIARRRAFAIISHPDAGKTTLTEKLLLYGGAIQLAGSVTSRKNQRAATSDWMELERQRGISVTSTVLQFEYADHVLNLLDTPGHRDFSEDTYRVLTAVDSVVMVIDAGKGIEPQTRKLFEICRQRGIPIFTFMNKLDRPTKPPLDLLAELEGVLGIQTYPMNWPLGTGFDFKGVYSRQDKQAHFFERTVRGAQRAPVEIASLEDPAVRDLMSDEVFATVHDELELLEGASAEFDEAAVHRGELTPVFFGSAANNFGVELLLQAFVRYGLPPQPKHAQSAAADHSSIAMEVKPTDPAFSGFVFKIQANMDPRHRDRIAFVRVCSGRFEREMPVQIARSGKRIKLNSSHKLFGQDRETVDEAWPGDIIGIVGHGDLRIGDTLAEQQGVEFHELPRFAPEVFAYLHSDNTSQFKRFREGLDQLLQEGVVQVLSVVGSNVRVPLLGAVGQLQFEVVQYRLKHEYGADSRLERTSWSALRWVDPSTPREVIDGALMPTGAKLAQDQNDRLTILFESEWSMRYFADKNPTIKLISISAA
jgi:peptide chain release factor 3